MSRLGLKTWVRAAGRAYCCSEKRRAICSTFVVWTSGESGHCPRLNGKRADAVCGLASSCSPEKARHA
eukprot:15484785-Alexandrium_andersonii.AAC.1